MSLYTKSTKSIKSTKRQASDFLPLRCFYAHKNTVSFVLHTKKHEKHKNAYRRTNDFLLLRYFLSASKCFLFCFCSLICVFVLLVRVKSFCKKKKDKKTWNCPNNLIYITTDLYPPWTDLLRTNLYALIFICKNNFFSWSLVKIFFLSTFYNPIKT